jgi:hypothetical protein
VWVLVWWMVDLDRADLAGRGWALARSDKPPYRLRNRFLHDSYAQQSLLNRLRIVGNAAVLHPVVRDTGRTPLLRSFLFSRLKLCARILRACNRVPRAIVSPLLPHEKWK